MKWLATAVMKRRSRSRSKGRSRPEMRPGRRVILAPLMPFVMIWQPEVFCWRMARTGQSGGEASQLASFLLSQQGRIANRHCRTDAAVEVNEQSRRRAGGGVVHDRR